MCLLNEVMFILQFEMCHLTPARSSDQEKTGDMDQELKERYLLENKVKMRSSIFIDAFESY